MSWLLIVIIAYFLLAVVNLGDKFLMERVMPSSRVYACLISLMSAIVFVAAPWLLQWPGWSWLGVNLAVGLMFPWALWLMFAGIKRGDTSQITILIGSTIPIFSLLLSYVALGDRYNANQLGGMALLIIGSLMIVFIKDKTRRAKNILTWQTVIICLGSALIFALYFIGTKFVYEHQNFLSSYLWLAGGNVLGALVFFIPRTWRQEILDSLGLKKKSRTKPGHRFLVLLNQAGGGIGSLLQHYAISFGPVAIINALQGVQYGFLILGGWALTIFYPKILKENISAAIIAQKTIAIVIICLGLYFIM